jgi:hypothetical protein
MSDSPSACDSATRATALPYIDTAMVFRRPTRSARTPPSHEATTSPTPKAATANPACPALYPARVRYRTRNITEKLAKRLRKAPAVKNQAGAGSSRRFRRRVRPGSESALTAAG